MALHGQRQNTLHVPQNLNSFSPRFLGILELIAHTTQYSISSSEVSSLISASFKTRISLKFNLNNFPFLH